MKAIRKGSRFGKWKVLGQGPNTAPRPPRDPNGKTTWLCRCECGAEQNVISNNLTGGYSRGCKDCTDPHERRLTENQYLQIRRRAARGESGVFLATLFNISPMHISKIIRGKTVWCQKRGLGDARAA